MFVFAQILGVITTIIVIAALQMKNIKTIFFFEALANLLVAASCLLLSGLSGAAICIAATVQTVISYMYSSKEKEAPKVLTVGFMLVYIILSVFTYKELPDVLPCIGALVYAVAVGQKKPFIFRIMMILNAAVWIGYDVWVGAYSLILTYVFQLTSSAVGIIRIDLKKKKTAKA